MKGIETVYRVLGEPLRSFNYKVEFPSDIAYSREVSYLVQSVSIPGLNVDPSSGMPFKPNLDISLPSKKSIPSSFSVTFVENENQYVSKFLDNWFSRIFHKNGEMHPPSKYWRDIKVKFLSVSGESLFSVVLFNCYPTINYKYDLDSSSNDVEKMTIPFAYTDIERE